MSVSILEALQNAIQNLGNVRMVGVAILPMVESQLNNACKLLDKGYSLEDKVEPLLEKYGSVENVPQKEQ